MLGAPFDALVPEAVIRFGRYPVSKRATAFLANAGAINIVVDPLETRDFNCATDVHLRCTPLDFSQTMLAAKQSLGGEDAADDRQRAFAAAWLEANAAAAVRVDAVDAVEAGFEGAFVRRVAERAPEGSCLFAANSMSVRALDTFYAKGGRRLTVLCNRGLNGIDGTVSTALGAAQHFEQTTLLTGDLTLLHAQDVEFGAAAQAFGVPHRLVETVAEFDAAYDEALGVPGISLVEVRVPLEGLPERYAPYWS